jgi:hypothetical protein
MATSATDHEHRDNRSMMPRTLTRNWRALRRRYISLRMSGSLAEASRFSNLYRTVRPFTLGNFDRIASLYKLARDVQKRKAEGSFVELGVWRGGCAAVMAWVAKEEGLGRRTYAFDSFEGLPEPTEADGVQAADYAHGRTSGKLAPIGACVSPYEDFEKLFFDILEIDRKNVEVRKGWFQDTVPVAAKTIGPIAILRLDGDWYESTKVCLEHLYDKVIPGGYVVIDDYGHWQGCRVAVDEFFQARGINPELVVVDYTCRYFVKP